MTIVLIESPFSHPSTYGLTLHRAYLEACLHHSLMKGETPFATHKLYTECLDDNNPIERRLGMSRSEVLLSVCDFVAVYYDLGISRGMIEGMTLALKLGKTLMPRSLYGHPISEYYNIVYNEIKERFSREP